MPPIVVGPKYIDDAKNGVVPAKPVADKMPPQIETEKVISYPLLPIEDHGSKYTTQEFGCSGKGLNLDRQKVLASPGNRDIGDRHACLVQPKNLYEPTPPKVHTESLKALIHPVLVQGM